MRSTQNTPAVTLSHGNFQRALIFSLYSWLKINGCRNLISFDTKEEEINIRSGGLSFVMA
jgi:hypothetical protein